MPKPDAAPKLGDWLTATEVADALRVSRQSVNRMIHDGKFETLAKIGDRPTYVVSAEEVAAAAQRRGVTDDTEPRHWGSYTTLDEGTRAQVVDEVKAGEPYARVGEKFGISRQTVANIVNHLDKSEVAS